MPHRNNRNGSIAYCPACDAQIYFRKQPKRGMNITCRECESLLSVVRSSPIQLKWAFEDPFEVESRNSRREMEYADYDEFDDSEYYDEDYDWDD